MKKLYTNKLAQFILIFCSLMFIGCQEHNIDSQAEMPLNIQIDALDAYTVLATSPSNVVFNISANTPWTISSDQQWCTPSPTMSASSSLVSEIVVTAEPNTGKKSRIATLTIKADNLADTKTIVIEQVSKEELVVIPYDELVATEGENISFSISSNKAWEIVPSSAFVSNIDKKTGTGNENAEEETITITIPSNSGAKREGTITVKTEFEEFAFVITQNGIIIEQEENPESTTVSINGTTIESIIKIRANKEWKVEVPQEFQKWLKAEAVSDTELKITTTVSNLLSNRIGSILLKTKDVIDGFDGIVFDIIQAPAYWKNGSESQFIIDEETGFLKVLGGGIASNYLFKKGKLTFDYESINITDNSWIEFNMWTDHGKQPNFHLHFKPGATSNFTCGGELNWTQQTFTWSTEQINTSKKIELIVDYKVGDANLLVIRLLINGNEVAVLDNNIVDCYKAGDDVNYPGQTVWLKLNNADGISNYTIKSITWEPID